MKIPQKKEDSAKVKGRVFSKRNGWYFSTREGIDIGPHPTRQSAEREVEFYFSSLTEGV